MKKVTLLFAALLLACTGAQANSLKTPVNLSMTQKVDGSADVAYDSSTKTITWAEGTTGTGLGQFGLSYNVADYDRIVIKITSSTCSNVRFRMDDDNTGGVWGCSYVDIGASDQSRTFTIDLPASYNEGESRSYSVIKRMWFNTNNVGNIVIDEIYLEKDFGGATTAQFGLDLSTFTGGWGANKVAATTSTLTKTTGENDGWELSGLSYDVSYYDRFVVKVNSSTLSDLHVRIANGDNFKTQTIGTVDSETTFTIELSGSSFTADNSTAVSTITRIWFASESSDVTGSATISAIYFEKDLTVEDALTRSNTTADKYGTICLPFTAAVPTNATVYAVAGVDNQETPTTLYLNEVSEMVAGKAYIYQSTDANDITFTKTGTDKNLASADAGTNYGLVGTFADATISGYMLHSGEWYSVNSKTCKAYRAYLDLNETSVYSTPALAARRMSITPDGNLTGINAIQQDAARQAIYNLSGQRISADTMLPKGVFIKNGKKIIVK